jgi:hypothetical protein
MTCTVSECNATAGACATCPHDVERLWAENKRLRSELVRRTCLLGAVFELNADLVIDDDLRQMRRLLQGVIEAAQAAKHLLVTVGAVEGYRLHVSSDLATQAKALSDAVAALEGWK